MHSDAGMKPLQAWAEWTRMGRRRPSSRWASASSASPGRGRPTATAPGSSTAWRPSACWRVYPAHSVQQPLAHAEQVSVASSTRSTMPQSQMAAQQLDHCTPMSFAAGERSSGRVMTGSGLMCTDSGPGQRRRHQGCAVPGESSNRCRSASPAPSSSACVWVRRS